MVDLEQPEITPDSATTEGTATDATQVDAPQVTDIGTLDKFTFQGKEWTPKELQSAYMMNADYTRKTQALAEERKYWDNIDSDLKAVRSDPRLMAKFMEIYPQKFHSFLSYVSSNTSSQQAQTTQTGQTTPNSIAQMDPEFYREWLETRNQLKEEKVAALEEKLESTFERMETKYPFADRQSVLAKAEYIVSNKENPDWDKLYKESNDRISGISKTYYSKQVTAQKTANKTAKDVATGGGIPGTKPKVPRTIKEATEFAMEEINRS